MRFTKSLCVASLTVAATAAHAATDAAPVPTHLKFETHAAFFSAETKQPKPIDPQVFVSDAGVAEGTGPQGIKHVAGFRPALIEADAKSTPLFNAQGTPLGFTLAEWLAPTGQATMTQTAAGGVVIKLSFEHLRPSATSSLFENHFDQKPVGFTPLDGAGCNWGKSPGGQPAPAGWARERTRSDRGGITGAVATPILAPI